MSSLTGESNLAVATLRLDAEEANQRITNALREQVLEVLKRRGVIVAMSGGVDSSVCAALAVRAFGAARVFAVFLPERDSDPESLSLATRWAEELGIEHVTEDITATLVACGCYRRRDDAIRRLVPDFDEGWKSKIVLQGSRLDSDRLNVFQLVVKPPEGESRTVRLPPAEYREIIAATSFKQRVRKMMEYYHADRLHYAVVGTPNRLEYDQGFFVKGGDGLADVKPIAHLYKSQVYQLAEYLGVPTDVTARPPSTETYSLPQTQEEFFFAVPLPALDAILHAHTARRSVKEAALSLGYQTEQIERVYREIERKRAATRYLHHPPLLVEDVSAMALPHPVTPD
jgi:NAD+ synthase